MDYLPAFMRDVMRRRARVQPATPPPPPPPPPPQLSIQEKHEAYMKKKEDMEKYGDFLYSREGLIETRSAVLAKYNRDMAEFLRVNRDVPTSIARAQGAVRLYDDLDIDALA